MRIKYTDDNEYTAWAEFCVIITQLKQDSTLIIFLNIGRQTVLKFFLFQYLGSTIQYKTDLQL